MIFGLPLAYLFYYLYQTQEVQTQLEPTNGETGFKQVLNEEFIQLDFFSLFVIIFFNLLIFAWFWSMAIGLQKNVPMGITMKVKKFKLLFFIPLFYILFLTISTSGLLHGMTFSIYSHTDWIVVIIPSLHLLSIFCILHSMYFVAKTIKTVELQRKTKLGDFALEFFLIWFYFIGIWFIQPKVNKLYGRGKHQSKKEP